MTDRPDSPIRESVFPGHSEASVDRMTSGRVPGSRSQGAVARPTRPAVERWENEGGHLQEPRSVAITPTDVSLRAPSPLPASAELAAMRARFLADFSGGLMGQHHNTFQHRSRVLRQLT